MCETLKQHFHGCKGYSIHVLRIFSCSGSNPIRKAKIVYNFGLSERNRVNKHDALLCSNCFLLLTVDAENKFWFFMRIYRLKFVLGMCQQNSIVDIVLWACVTRILQS